jgi:pimeloyl-ACP methyl ester carboxylesterase
MWKWIAGLVLPLLALAAVPAPVQAAPREARIALYEGKLRTADLTAALSRELNLPECSLDCGDIDLRALGGSLWVAAVNEALGEGCRISVTDDELVLHVDTEKLPDDVSGAKRAARVFTAVAAPDATAKQRAYYGLWTPPVIDTSRPLVVLVHGLDCDRLNWAPLIKLLEADGRQVAMFTYPSDQPIVDSAKALGDKLAELRLRMTSVRYDLVCHSMGGLVAREYVEGEGYRGGVERLVMLGTPNTGSSWASYRLALELEEHYHLWRHEPNWSLSWMITDGLGEAGTDLKPGSAFLTALNSRDRREGVKYTIVAGNQHPARRITANCLEDTAGWIPQRAANWWGFRQTKNKLEGVAGRMRQRGESDGPVTVESCRLAGVDDFVIVPADHVALYYPRAEGKPPAAWDTIRDRLSR